MRCQVTPQVVVVLILRCLHRYNIPLIAGIYATRKLPNKGVSVLTFSRHKNMTVALFDQHQHQHGIYIANNLASMLQATNQSEAL